MPVESGCHNHHHSQDHEHLAQMRQSEKNLRLTVLAQVGFVIVQLGGAFLTGSQALLSDAIHAMTDGLAVLVAWLGEVFSHLSAKNKKVVNYQRISLISAGIVVILVLWGAVEIGHHSWERLSDYWVQQQNEECLRAMDIQ